MVCSIFPPNPIDGVTTHTIDTITYIYTGGVWESLTAPISGSAFFIHVWDVTKTYNAGDVVQTTDGNLWKAVMSNIGNDPSTDIGTNWLPAVDLTGGGSGDQKGISKTGNFTATNKDIFSVTNGDITMPVIEIEQVFEFYSVSGVVRLLNPLYTIIGSAGSIVAGDNMIIETGVTVKLIAETANILRMTMRVV